MVIRIYVHNITYSQHRIEQRTKKEKEKKKKKPKLLKIIVFKWPN